MTQRISVLGKKRWVRAVLSLTVLLGGATSAVAIVTALGLVGELHEPQGEHVDQAALHELVQAGEKKAAFDNAFVLGDELFEATFNALDGVGANVGNGQRFTRVPRADLSGTGEWASHFPARETGPNAQACVQCHNQPFDDGAGTAAMNVHRDPKRNGNIGEFIQRNTPHLFGIGALQRLAEEMTEDLHAIRDRVEHRACKSKRRITRRLRSKGVRFGRIRAKRVSKNPCKVEFDTSRVTGVDSDLVVRPLQWKGAVNTVRDFNRGAAHNELGMQPVETAGNGVDGDFDGVTDEFTIGDMTAMAVYIAAQPRPTTRVELARLGLIEPLAKEEKKAIRRGRRMFRRAQCTACHKRSLRIEVPIFSEPSQNPNYRDAVFPAGQDPIAEGVDPANPVSFDLTKDLPDNVIKDATGTVVASFGNFRRDRRGRAVVRLFGDLKRHDMGPELAESVDETGTGSSVWLTKELWGVGSTAPYLHDGRATTLTEAILAHGGEAKRSRKRFVSMSKRNQAGLIAYLNNLVLFKVEEGEEAADVPEPPKGHDDDDEDDKDDEKHSHKDNDGDDDKDDDKDDG